MKTDTITIAHADAQATLYLDGPAWPPCTPVATLGQFHCESAEAGTALIREAMQRAAAVGAEAMLGPMDGDTWHAYRVVVDGDDTPPFLMEPISGRHDRQAFTDAGFTEVSRYVSARAALADIVLGEPRAVEGIAIDHWRGDDPEALFAEVHALSVAAFAGNPFYRLIALDEFLALYRPVLPHLVPELILFAHEANGALAGFVFGIPDFARGPATDTVIFKTYAATRRGVGHAMSQRFHANAMELGYRNVIHALMHESNVSLMRSGQHEADVFRRYALLGRRLDV